MLLDLMMQRNELRALGDAGPTVIVAQARKSASDADLYSFVHCDVTGTGTTTFLARAWMTYPKIIFAYSTMTNVVHPKGWDNGMHPEFDK